MIYFMKEIAAVPGSMKTQRDYLTFSDPPFKDACPTQSVESV